MPSTVYDPPALESGTLRVTPLGGLGEIGRNMTVFEYDGQAPHRRLRRALPRGAPARRRPDPPGLRADQAPAGRRRRRGAHPRARGPHRRGSLPAQAQAGHPDHRLGPDPGTHRGEAEGASRPPLQPHGEGGPAREARSRSTSSSSPSTTPSPTRSRSRSARLRARCWRRATSRWTSCRWTAG